MYLNTAPAAPLGKPCWRDMAELVSDKGLLPARLVALMSLKQLRRRAHEIEATHPQYREELPLVLQGEAQRRGHFTRGLRVTASQSQVA